MPPTDKNKDLTDELIVPLRELVVQVARGVAEAQRSLDEQSLAFQKEIFTDEEMEEFKNAGIQATWFQIPEVTAKLKVSVSMHSETETSSGGIKPKRHLLLAPYNANYKNAFDYDLEGASELNMKIVPVPPPAGAMVTLVPHLVSLSREAAEIELAEARLVLGEINEAKSTEAPGTVIAQDPPPESQINIGDPVDLTLAKS